MYITRLVACCLFAACIPYTYAKPRQAVPKKRSANTMSRAQVIKEVAQCSVKLIPKKMATVTPEFTSSLSMYLGVLISKAGLIITSEEVVNSLGDEVIAVVESDNGPKYYSASVKCAGLGYALLQISAAGTEFRCIERAGFGAAGDGVYAVYLNRDTGGKEVSQARVASIRTEYLPLTAACVGECVNLSTIDPLYVGCPVFNERGELFGICTMTQASRSTVRTKTVLTITWELIRQVVDGIAMERRYIAVEANPYSDPTNHQPGVRVRTSVSGNLRADDTIVGVNGSSCDGLYHLIWMIQKVDADSVTLRVVREGKEIDIVEPVHVAPSRKVINVFQAALQPMILNTGECVLHVLHIESISSLIKYLSVGESILGINGVGFKNAEDAVRMLKEAVGKLQFNSVPFVLEVADKGGDVITKRAVKVLSI